jgi:hypothetical protein
MLKLFTTFLLTIIAAQLYSQAQQKISVYILIQHNSTLYDITKGNNPWGIGTGLQFILNNDKKLRPAAEFTADAYFEDDKVLRLGHDGKIIKDIRSMLNFFVGPSFHPSQSIYVSFIAGPAFINGNILPGIKPSISFFFSKKHRWTGKVSYINIFNRDKATAEDFGSLSMAIGLKLF